MSEFNSRYCCHRCFKDNKSTLIRQRMIVCLVCGNKRCPKATDHDLDCTHSNAEDQLGSVYGILIKPLK